jgi:hypothetical protein
MLLLQYAIIEHNVVAASKLYHNISFVSLGKLLGVTPAKVRCRAMPASICLTPPHKSLARVCSAVM